LLRLCPPVGESESCIFGPPVRAWLKRLPPPARSPIVLCWNENPYGPSPAARAVISGTIANACRYPDEEITQLVELLARKEGLPPTTLWWVRGRVSCCVLLACCTAAGAARSSQPEPTYAELTNYAKNAGADLAFVPVDKQLNHDLAAMRAAVSGRTRAVYVCKP